MRSFPRQFTPEVRSFCNIFHPLFTDIQLSRPSYRCQELNTIFQNILLQPKSPSGWLMIWDIHGYRRSHYSLHNFAELLRVVDTHCLEHYLMVPSRPATSLPYIFQHRASPKLRFKGLLVLPWHDGQHSICHVHFVVNIFK